ncbi:hypothetical protein D9619_007662 [Psilocybe cf. subviscida]|uniref:BZIP domain-containing protein n=1 Tax=Psilocybe cf. subviscida TaxID=2480587 RepID=A0A8H5ATT2_9AGAR|nr:hypothetical protein D9619_007662 [Psilocybe cf. subviscida]
MLTTAGHHRPFSLRASVRRLFALAAGGQTASAGGIFDGAQNTHIQNATFTINQYGGIVVDQPQADAVANEGRQSREDMHTRPASPRQEYDLPQTPRRESPDVYVDCLLTENRGYPLWIPSPSTSLPELNQKLGVSLGDVGVLTPEGGFDFLFNIFHDARHPINATMGVPKGFVPFRPGFSTEFVEWNAGSYLADPSIVRVDDGSNRSKTILEATGTEAAVLMIPEEIRTTHLRNTTCLQKYVAEHIATWYKFVKHELGYDNQNGDLRVVYGCRKSSGFGIATAFNTGRRGNTQLTFSVDSTWADVSGCPYLWNHTGSAEVKVGPFRQETSDVPSRDPVRNQCLFISTIDTKISAEIWRDIEGMGIGTPMDDELQLTFNAWQPRDGPSRQPAGESYPRGPTNAPSSPQYYERTFHPSAILHDILETIAPHLPVYMVCDDDWAPFITKKNMSARDFVKHVLDKRMIVESQGMAYFCEGGQFTQVLGGKPVAEIRFHCIDRIEDRKTTGRYHWKATRTERMKQTTSSGKALSAEPNRREHLALLKRPSELTGGAYVIRRKVQEVYYWATVAESFENEHDPYASPRRESPDVYVDCLLTKSRGYPLWIPSPSTSLPAVNRTLGVSPGDVGVFTPEGGFDYLFNIFHNATHPINAAVGLPEGFIPFSPVVGPEFVEWNAGSYLADSSIIRVDDGRDLLKTTLEATGPEAAVLMIPKEIRTSQLRITTPLRKYVKENIAVWYKFVRHTLGHEIENGDLRVVYGCRKSSGFGIATAFNAGRQENTKLTFSIDNTWASISGCPYRWNHTGSAEVKAGPTQEENSEISVTEPVRNQCLFVNTIDARVSAEIWSQIEELEITTAMDTTLDSTPPHDGFSQHSTDQSDTGGSTNSPPSHRYHEVHPQLNHARNPFDDTSLTPHSFDLEENWASLSALFADDFPINAQDPEYTSTTPAYQGRRVSASAGGPSSMASLASFESQLLDPLTPYPAIPMPQFNENRSNIVLHHPLSLLNGGDSNNPHSELELQRLATQSQSTHAHAGLQPRDISPSGSASPAPALSRSSSGRRQATPSASDEDRDNAPLLKLPSNATAEERVRYKRAQNTLAARRAKRRREAQESRMESDVVRLQREADTWRQRAKIMEDLLENAGIPVPKFSDDV